MALLLIVLLAVLMAFAFILSKPIGQIMRMRRVPTLPIAALPNGVEAEVVGRAGGRVDSSPISETPCVLWQVEVQEYRGSGKSGHWMRKV